MNVIILFYLSLVVVLFFLFYFRRKLQQWLSTIAKVLFYGGTVCALLGVFLASPFVYFAQRYLENSGTLEMLQKVDSTVPVSQVVTPITDAADWIKRLLSIETAERSEEQAASPNEKKGLLEKEVYPTLVSNLALFYRTITVLFATISMVGGLYLSYTVGSLSELEELRKRVDRYEEQLAKK